MKMFLFTLSCFYLLSVMYIVGSVRVGKDNVDEKYVFSNICWPSIARLIPENRSNRLVGTMPPLSAENKNLPNLALGSKWRYREFHGKGHLKNGISFFLRKFKFLKITACGLKKSFLSDFYQTVQNDGLHIQNIDLDIHIGAYILNISLYILTMRLKVQM